MTRKLMLGALAVAMIGLAGIGGYQTGAGNGRGFIGCEAGHLAIRNIEISGPFLEPVVIINIPTDPCGAREPVPGNRG